MDSLDKKHLLNFLLTSSRTSLGSFLLARLSEDSNTKKELLGRIAELLDSLVETRAKVLLANLIRDHGEEIAAHFSSPQQLPELPQRVLHQMKAATKA